MVGSIPENLPYACPLVSEANNVKREGRKLVKKGGYKAELEEKQGIGSERLRDMNKRNFSASRGQGEEEEDPLR